MTELETRLRRLEDREQIRALIGTYSVAIDDHDFDRLATCFAPDATYGRHGDTDLLHGRDAIRASMAEKLGGAGPSFHVNHDSFVTFDENDADKASGMVLCHAETSHLGGHRIAAIRYYDSYGRAGGKWQITARRLKFLYFVKAEDYVGALERAAG